LMMGLGFDSKKKDKTVVEEPVDDKYANFNMHIRQGDATSESTPIRNNFQMDAFNMGMRDNLIIYCPTSMKEIQSAVDCLRQNQSVMLDLEKIGDEDLTRVLDFISGAIYGLNGSIHRFKDDSFIITPEGKKILTPDKKD
ncbi:MAG: cell division protein SepF, partial [Clostridia bacterium]|nr:cell division protein SepF [Clostridia bacterium]